jgi:uncharacterized membrane protein
MDFMNSGLHLVYEIVEIIIRVAIIICNAIGVLVILNTVFSSTINYFHKDRHVKQMLAKGIALALEFKLAAEVLRTVTVRELNELIILGTIILLRGAITLLIHWEIKTELADEEQERKMEIERGEVG